MAVVLLIEFSSGFEPVRVRSFLNDTQFVWTVKIAVAVLPLDCPIACTLCDPGCAALGTINERVKTPELSAVAVPLRTESKFNETVSKGENPEPVARTRLVGGPLVGEIDSDAAAAKLARPAITETNRI